MILYTCYAGKSEIDVTNFKTITTVKVSLRVLEN